MERENNKILRKLSKTTGKTIYNYSLISEGDHIVTGLSGGKDSLTLLDILAEKKRKMPINFNITACYVELESLGHKINIDELQDFCKSRDITFMVKRINPDLNLHPGKDKCFICSWFRRKTLFNLCRELNAHKLALGHNMDDIVETFIMNTFFQGNISTMPVKLSMFEGELFIIRPLAEVEESLIEKYSSIKNLKVQRQECTYSKAQSRSKVKNIILELEKFNPDVRRNIFNSLKNIKKDYLL